MTSREKEKRESVRIRDLDLNLGEWFWCFPTIARSDSSI